MANLILQKKLYNLNKFEIFNFCLLFALTFISILLLWVYPSRILFDQNFIRFVFWKDLYPNLDAGITSNLLVGFYNLLVQPSTETLNPQIKTIALLMFVFPGYFLAKKVLQRPLAVTLFILFLFFSRLPFLWLSSELFVSSFFCLSVLGILSKWRPCLCSLFLILFGLCKPDLILPAVFMFYFYIVSLTRTKDKFEACLTFLGLLLIFTTPSFLTYGKTAYGGRGLIAFSQHYYDLFFRHQFSNSGSLNWDKGEEVVQSVFHGAQS